MQIKFTTNFTNGGQVYSVYEHIPIAKSDTGLCFIPYSSVYWRSYLVGGIPTSRGDPLSVGNGSHIFLGTERMQTSSWIMAMNFE